jgi:hypothetical protein
MQTRSTPSVQSLHRLARQAAIPGYEVMSKANLFKKLQDQYDIERLTRAEARRSSSNTNTKKRKGHGEEGEGGDSSGTLAVASSSSSSSSSSIQLKMKKVKLNSMDPIMLTAIGKKAHTFKFTRPNGTEVRFLLESLIDYVVASGEFSDPETRLQFSDEDLQRIDALAQKAGLDKPSVVSAKGNTQFYVDAKFTRDAIQGLERCAGEVVADILDVVETLDPDDAQMQLVMREFPTFLDYYRQLRDANPAYASQCLQQWKQFIQGPPNRPYHDEYGLLHVSSRRSS